LISSGGKNLHDSQQHARLEYATFDRSATLPAVIRPKQYLAGGTPDAIVIRTDY
jgi:hypothetical protein